MARPGTALDAPFTASGVDKRPLSDAKPSRKGLSVGCSDRPKRAALKAMSKARRHAYCTSKVPAELRTTNRPLPTYCKSIASYGLPEIAPETPVVVVDMGVGVEV